LVADTQIWPTVALPFGTPFTVHVTEVSEASRIVATNARRWPGASVAAGGEMLMLSALVSVTVADAVAALPPAGIAVAWMVTGFAAGIAAGAV
jgi:hypothetical protein